MTTLFIDTEFTSFDDPRLLSIALVSEHLEFYVHLEGPALKDALTRASNFVEDFVAGQLTLRPASVHFSAAASNAEIGQRLPPRPVGTRRPKQPQHHRAPL